MTKKNINLYCVLCPMITIWPNNASAPKGFVELAGTVKEPLSLINGKFSQWPNKTSHLRLEVVYTASPVNA